MFKRVMPLVGTLLLMMLLCGTALAAEQPVIADREQALAAAKKLLPEVVADQQFEVEYRENDYQGKRVWSLNLRQDGRKPGLYTSIYIDIDADTGDLLSYYYHAESTVATGNGQAITKDTAREIALKFVARMQPDLLSQMRLEDNNPLTNYYGQTNLNLSYSFKWVRVIRGIPVQRDGVSVQVDAVTGDVVGYNFIWTNYAKTSTVEEKILMKQQVADTVVNNYGFYPNYMIGSNNTAQLIYSINSLTNNFDAATGIAVNYNGIVKNNEDNKKFSVQFNQEIGSPKITAVQPIEKIDPVQAQKTAEKFFEKRGFKGTVRHSGGGSSVGPGFRNEHWNYSIEQSASNNLGRADVNVGIDVYSGRIVSYRNYSEETQSSGKAISEGQAAIAAEKFLKDVIGNDVQYVQRNATQYLIRDEQENYRFEYAVLLNGVPAEDNNINMEINRYSGEVVGYRYQPMLVNTPELNQIISPEKAAEIFKEASPLRLSYATIMDDQFTPTNQLMLVYQLDNIRGIDAHSGELLQGAEAGQSVSPKLANHWARASLELLADSGLLPETGFNPDGNVTRRQAIKVLTAASQYYANDSSKLKFTDLEPSDPDIETIRRAVEMGMFENQGQLNLNAPLTREQLAVWVVNGIGYREVAELPVKMEVAFSDHSIITAKYKNYVAIAAGLEIFSGDKNGNFNPHKSVTWAELATIVTRVAPKLNNY